MQRGQLRMQLPPGVRNWRSNKPGAAFDSMTDNSTMAAGALWSKRLNRVLNAIEQVLFAVCAYEKLLS